MDFYDTVIIGAGAAGLFCAWNLSAAKMPFLLLERGGKAGRKLAASGGGHANFTNENMAPDCFTGNGAAKFCKFALKEFTPKDNLNFISSLNLHYIQKNNGKYFMRDPASALVAKLLEKIDVHLALNAAVSHIAYKSGIFDIHAGSQLIQCERLVLAPGSPASPVLAQCPDCWAILEKLGLPVLEQRPALAPLIYPDSNYREFGELSGLSVHVKTSVHPDHGKHPYFEDQLLFTHFGLSGPAILNISLYFNAGETLCVDFLPQRNFEKLCDEGGGKTAQEILARHLPRKLARMLLPETLRERKCANLSRQERQLLGTHVNNRAFAGLRTGGLSRAEICAGGVDLAALDPRSMQARNIPGLYVIGEAQNVAGHLGGYNLHWAMASAKMAARHIATNTKR